MNVRARAAARRADRRPAGGGRTSAASYRGVDTSDYMPFERVDAVEETERGLLATLHGEQLRIDVCRDDVVRVKISRGGSFDDKPTHAVCVDPVAGDVEHSVERGE